MFRKKMKIEVVPENQYTDFSDRLIAEGNKYATKRTVAAALVPVVITVPIVAHSFQNNVVTPMSIPVAPSEQVATAITPPPPIESFDVASIDPSLIPVSMTTPEVIPAGFIADKSLEAIANVMDPLIQILVAVSFPVASVIMVGACFFFMFGNSEKAWSLIMNAGLGYVLIQMSPLFLNMLRTVGESV